MATFPVEFGFSDMTITDNQPVLVSTARSLKRQTRRIPAQRWEVKLKTRPYLHTDRRALRAFLIKHGSHTPFDIVLPVDADSLGSLAGTATVSSVAEQGDTEFILGGATGSFSPGDWIKFTSHAKVYSVIEQVGTTVEIWPPLKQAVTSDIIVYNDVPMTVLATAQTVTNELTTNGGTSQTNIDLVEDV